MANIFHITTGDIDGIGLEVTLKSLKHIRKITPGCKFVIWVHTSQIGIINKFLTLNKDILYDSSFSTTYPNKNIKLTKFIFLENSNPTPAGWFEKAVEECLSSNDSLVTAPLSKVQIHKEGYKEIGHTDILKAKTKIISLNMAFIGKYFSMILYSGHIPVYQVKFDVIGFKKFLNKAFTFHVTYKSKRSKFVTLGLNPHAGDNGIIGLDDLKISKIIHNKNPLLEKPIPADSAFVNYKNFKFNPTFLSLYHDQGLIPFKMAHGFSGFHFTLGLPFVRTSVDHGTAKDIYNKNIADPTSMIDAILGAIKLKKGSKFI